MLTGIDHLVVLVDDLETAISDYAGLGFSVVRGGRHPGGTHNALVGFSDGSFAGVLRQAAEPIGRDDLDASGVRFTVGRHVVDYLTPRRSVGPLGDWLRIEGPSPYAVTLTVDAERAEPLDAAKLRRARLATA